MDWKINSPLLASFFIHSINPITHKLSSNFTIIPDPVQARRFMPSMGQAMKHSLKYILQFDNIKKIFIVSESCIPLQSISTIYNVTINNNYSIFSSNRAYENGLSSMQEKLFNSKDTKSFLGRMYGIKSEWNPKISPDSTRSDLFAIGSSQWQVIDRCDGHEIIKTFDKFMNWYKSGKISRIWMTDSTIFMTIIISYASKVGRFYPYSAQRWKQGNGNSPLTCNKTNWEQLKCDAFILDAHKKGFLSARKFKNVPYHKVHKILKEIHVL